MRTPSPQVRLPGSRAAFVVACLVLSVASMACGGSAATPPQASAGSLDTPPPDRHLTGNIDPNRVFQMLASGGLSVHQESIGNGGSGEPVQILFVRDGFQPLAIAQYSSPKALADAGYVRGATVKKGDAPYNFWAANVLIQFGPRDSKAVPAAPGPDLQAEAAKIVAIIDPYLGPLDQRSVIPLALPSSPKPTTAPTAAPTPQATSKPSPKASPKSSPKATPKPKKP